MPRIKLVWSEIIYEGSEDSILRVAGSTGDWQEVSEQDLKILKDNLNLASTALDNKISCKLYIIQEETRSIAEILEYIAKGLKEQAKQKKANDERLARARKQLEAKGAERKRRQYEKLKKEFEDGA